MGTKFKVTKSQHPYVRFGNSDEDGDAKIILHDLFKRDMLVAPAIDWDRLEAIGISAKLEPFLIRTFHDPALGEVMDNSWYHVFHIHEDVHMELTLEFLSTFKYEKEATDEAIRFRLMGQWHDVSLPQFAYLLGLYPAELTSHPYFPNFLNTFEKESFSEMRCHEFFRGIADCAQTLPKDLKASQIRNPKHRMLHRLLSFTLNQSYGYDKCPYIDMPALWGAINPEVRFKLPHAFAIFFRDRAKGQRGVSPICGGNFITRIAKNLGDISNIQMLTVKSESPKILSENHFKKMLKRLSPNSFDFIDEPSPERPPGFEGEAQPSASRSRRRRQQGPAQSGPEQEVDLNFIYNQMQQMEIRRQQDINALGYYLDDTHRFMGHMYDQEGWDTPPQYPYPTWDMRRGGAGPETSTGVQFEQPGGQYQTQTERSDDDMD
ncbi:hypothetical protein OROMI_021128 [Orobanche minor]